MTTIESGTAQGIDYVPDETRAVAIHEAGHAVASHVYMADVLSTRLSIRKRGGSLGHHQAIEKEERFSSWRHEEVGKLVWTLGRDGRRARLLRRELDRRRRRRRRARRRARPGWSACAAWAPSRSTSTATAPTTPRRRARLEEEIMERFERIGLQIMNRAAGMRESGRPDRRDPRRPVQARRRRPDPRPGLPDRGLPRAPQPRAGRCGSPTRSSSARSCTATRSSRCSTPPACEAPDIDVTDETIWPKL